MKVEKKQKSPQPDIELPNGILLNVNYILEDIDLDLFSSVEEAGAYIRYGTHKLLGGENYAIYSDCLDRIENGDSVRIEYGDGWFYVFMFKDPTPNVVSRFTEKAIIEVIPSLKLKLDKDLAREKLQQLEEEKRNLIKNYKL